MSTQNSNGAGREGPEAGGRFFGAAAYLLPVAAAVAVHWRALQIGFLADDFEFWLQAGSLGRALAHFGQLGHRFIRPLPALLWWSDRLLYGEQAWGFHLTNLVIHCLNAALLFRLLTRLEFKRAAASRPAWPPTGKRTPGQARPRPW